MMAFDPTPWFVGGGAQHSPEVARALAYAGTRGSEGIAGVADLKVTAQSVPNGTVAVAPGGALLLNRYPGGTGQSYSLRNATTTNVTVTPTGSSSGRTDLVIARVLDPQYEGAAPADPTNFQYAYPTIIQGVPSGTLTAKELNLGYPAVALAKITLPASTGTVTSGMITDLRRVAQPRRDRAMVTVFPTGDWSNSTAQQIPTGSYGSWPITSAQRPSVLVPDWATRVDIVAHLSGVVYVKSSDNSQTTAGIRTGFGSTLPAQNGIIVQDGTDAGGRFHYTVIGTHIIDSTMRGTYQYINIQGNKSSGTGRWYGDYQTSVVIDWEFSEGAQ
jgi:hypothetical protein